MAQKLRALAVPAVCFLAPMSSHSLQLHVTAALGDRILLSSMSKCIHRLARQHQAPTCTHVHAIQTHLYMNIYINKQIFLNYNNKKLNFPLYI